MSLNTAILQVNDYLFQFALLLLINLGPQPGNVFTPLLQLGVKLIHLPILIVNL